MKIRAYLFLMALAILAPVVIFSAIALNLLLDSERSTAIRGLHETARATALMIDRELLATEAALTVLASSKNLATNDYGAFYKQARTADRGSGAWTLLHDSQGRQMVNTLVPFGTALPSAVAKERVQHVLQTQKTFVSDLVESPMTRNHVTTLDIPVTLSDVDQYVLTATFASGFFEQLIKQQAVPSSWIVAVIDRQGKFIARTRLKQDFTGALAKPEIIAAAAQSEFGQIRHKTVEGIDAYNVFTHSRISGWTIAVAAPAGIIEESARKAILLASLGLIAALIGAAVTAIFSGRYLFKEIDRAAASAVVLGKGAVPAGARSAVAEIQHLHDAIQNASQLLVDERDARQQAESERERLFAAETQARKSAQAENESKDQFLAMLGHEIRNPLSAINTATILIGFEIKDNPRLARAREVLERQSTNLAKIVDDLLDVTRVSMGKVNLRLLTVDLAKVTASCVQGLQSAGRMQGRTVVIDTVPAWVDADTTRLEQIINNLLINAVKYTSTGGTVTVTVTASETERQARLTITDTGIGMDAALLPNVFNLFVQAPGSLDRSQGGLGIGLTLVRQLVSLHGGSVEAHSPGIDQGSTFVVNLPLVASAPGPAAGLAHDAATTATAVTVLLIEDNTDSREMIAIALTAHGHAVHEAANGIDGLRIMDEVKPDIAVVDIGLPGMSGYEIARHCRQDKTNDGVTLIALTGYGQESDRQRALEAGFDFHLVKPVNLDALMQCFARTE